MPTRLVGLAASKHATNSHRSFQDRQLSVCRMEQTDTAELLLPAGSAPQPKWLDGGTRLGDCLRPVFLRVCSWSGESASASTWVVAGRFYCPLGLASSKSSDGDFGALKVPLDAQKLLVASKGTENAPSTECVIKGNVSRNGERIYHQPGQEYYRQIDMSKNNERRWFCTPEEAETAGYRKSRR